MMQEEDEFMANFQHILTDHSNNNTYKDTDTE
jgi:hypothetical protein